MSSNTKNINNLDDFSRGVADKVRNHQIPVEPDVWEQINKRLISPSRRNLRVLPWAIAGVAAILIGLLFLANPFSGNKIGEDAFVAQESAETEKITDRTFTEKEMMREPETENKSQTHFAQNNLKPRKRNTTQEKAQTNIIEQKESTETWLIEPVKKTTPTNRDENMSEISPQKALEKDENISLPIISEEEITEAPAEKTESKKRPLLTALISSGAGNIGLGNGDMVSDLYYTPIGDGLGLSNGNENRYKTLSPSEYSDIRHLPPLSVSALVEFPINRTWSIETGLMYTFMTTKFRKPEGNVIYRGNLDLHYLGIPTNLKANVYQNEKWRVYILGGGSIEKGLVSIYNQEIEYFDNLTRHTYLRSGINGFQFSAHTAAGFDYRINQNIRVFGEPGIIYYFKNNQPMSARTENPFTFGLNAGIRIQFK